MIHLTMNKAAIKSQVIDFKSKRRIHLLCVKSLADVFECYFLREFAKLYLFAMYCLRLFASDLFLEFCLTE